MRYFDFLTLLKQSVSVLVKFQKIRKHTDPSVGKKKELFLKKYQELIIKMAEGFKKDDAFENMNLWVSRFRTDNPFKLSERNLENVLAKISGDIENHFIEKPVLPEFKNSVSKDYTTKYVRAAESPPPKPSSPPSPPDPRRFYTREDLMDLVRSTKKKRAEVKSKKKALDDLSEYINKLRKLDPSIIENKIKEAIKGK